MGDAPIYATSKSAVTTLTELLYYQLRTQNTKLSCSVLYPGPNWLRTNLWEAWRTRPEEYAKTVDRAHAVPELRGVRAADGSGGNAAAGHAARGGRRSCARRDPRGSVLDQSEQRRPLDARYASMKARRNPDYFRNWNPTTNQ